MSPMLERVCLSLSEQFDRLMEARDLTQRALAWRLGRRQHGTVSHVLKARDSKISTIVALADALDCDVVVTLVPRPRVRSFGAPIARRVAP